MKGEKTGRVFRTKPLVEPAVIAEEIAWHSAWDGSPWHVVLDAVGMRGGGGHLGYMRHEVELLTPEEEAAWRLS